MKTANRRPIRSRRAAPRRGAALIETSLVLFTLVLLTLGVLELGIGLYRYHLVCAAARVGARRAIVHGEYANVKLGPSSAFLLGTSTEHPVVGAIEPMLVSCERERTWVIIQWPDGNNRQGSRVTVMVATPYRPALLGASEMMLSSGSTMLIEH